MPNLSENDRAIPQLNENGFKPSVAGKALAKALKHLMSEWGWTGGDVAEALHLKTRTLNNWLKKGSIPIEGHQLSNDAQSIIHLISIHRSLSAMFNDSEIQREWLNTKHPELLKTPTEKISESVEGLIFVRQYLDYVRGRGA